MWEANKVPPKIPGLFPGITIKDVVENVGKPRAVVSVVPVRSGCLSTRGALENPRHLWNQAALSCPYTFQQRLCVSHLQAPDCLSFSSMGTRCFEERWRVPGALQWKTLTALTAPVAWNVGTTDPTEDTLVPTPGVKMFPKDWASCSSFCYFPWFAFCHAFFFHSFAASYFSLVSLVSRKLPCFNFTKILTIEIHPIMCFKVNLNNSSSIISCELLRHLTQIVASAGMNRNLLNENQFLPESLFHPCNIFKCKFED